LGYPILFEKDAAAWFSIGDRLELEKNGRTVGVLAHPSLRRLAAKKDGLASSVRWNGGAECRHAIVT